MSENTNKTLQPENIISKFNNNFIPVILITPNSKTTKFGTYSEFVLSGNYICKILEHLIQCTKEEQNTKKCSQTYAFIGEKYNDLFPFNVIKSSEMSIGTSIEINPHMDVIHNSNPIVVPPMQAPQPMEITPHMDVIHNSNPIVVPPMQVH